MLPPAWSAQRFRANLWAFLITPALSLVPLLAKRTVPFNFAPCCSTSTGAVSWTCMDGVQKPRPQAEGSVHKGHYQGLPGGAV